MREYASAQRQCEAVARQNQALIKQQEDNQQRAQQQQAQQQRAMAEENQRRVQQQAFQEQQRRQQQALLEQQREAILAEQQRRQQFANQQQQQTLLEQRQRDALLAEQQRRQQLTQQQLSLLEQQREEAERQRRPQSAVQEQQSQQRPPQQPQRQQAAPVVASVVPPVPTADTAALQQRIRSAIEQATASYEAAMQRTVQVGDTALSVGGLKDTLVGLVTNLMSSVKSTTLLRGIGRGAGTALTNPVLEMAGPFLDPENGKNMFTAVDTVRRGGQGYSWSQEATRMHRELEAAEAAQYGTGTKPPTTPPTTDSRRSWYRN